MSRLLKSAQSATALVAALALAACESPVGPATQDLQPSFTTHDTPGETVTVCKVVTSGAAGPYDFTVSQAGGREGAMPAGSSFSLADGECVVVWVSAPNPPTADEPTVVTATEVNLPAGMQLDSVLVESVFTEDPSSFAGPDAWARANYYHGATITFFNSETPPPPPGCVGLTPGYWKNWANHYTAEEFASLLPGTIALSTAQAEAILGYGGNDPVQKLAKFVLANQLTLNLVGTLLPNPDNAVLNPDCTIEGASLDLGEALSAALDVLANPGAYTSGQINALKDLLDAIANMG